MISGFLLVVVVVACDDVAVGCLFVCFCLIHCEFFKMCTSVAVGRYIERG